MTVNKPNHETFKNAIQSRDVKSDLNLKYISWPLGGMDSQKQGRSAGLFYIAGVGVLHPLSP